MNLAKNIVHIFTDGSCSGNPGVGGWCGIMLYNDHKKIVSGHASQTTNQRMELLSVIQSLRTVRNREKYTIIAYSDSAYVVNGINNKWVEKWEKNGWRTSSGEVKNQDLWEELVRLVRSCHAITFEKVKGHDGVQYNEECDRIAHEETQKAKNILANQHK